MTITYFRLNKYPNKFHFFEVRERLEQRLPDTDRLNCVPVKRGITLITDNELIGKYLFKDDSSAFEELVHRHSGLVMGVCRGMLLQTQDAEDAFQATFLILSRKAKTLIDHGSIAGWLYHTAVRNCLQIRRRKSRIKETEMIEDPIGIVEPWHAISSAQENDLVYQEINRLPKNYRDAIVLCHLKGHSRAEAAELLDWTEAGVKAALARGRNLLRKRLVRSGILTTAVLTMLQTSTAAAKETVSESLVTSTIQHCHGILPNLPVGTSAHFVQTIANNGVMSMHALTTLKSISIAAALMIGVALPLGVLAQQTKISDPQPAISVEAASLLPEPKPGPVVAVSFEQEVSENDVTDDETETVQNDQEDWEVPYPNSNQQTEPANQTQPQAQGRFSTQNSAEYWNLMLQSYKLKAEGLEQQAKKSNDRLVLAEAFEYRAKVIEAELNLRRIKSEENNWEFLQPKNATNTPATPNSIPVAHQVITLQLPMESKHLDPMMGKGARVDLIASKPDEKKGVTIERRLAVFSITIPTDNQKPTKVAITIPKSAADLVGKYMAAKYQISVQPSFLAETGSVIEAAPAPKPRDPMRAQIVELEVQLAELSQNYGAGHPEVRLVRNKLAQLKQFIQSEVSKSAPPSSKTPVEPGERLTIESAIDSSINRLVTVMADRTISMPLVGVVDVSGLNVGQIQEILDQEFKKFLKDPSIFVARESSSMPLKK